LDHLKFIKIKFKYRDKLNRKETLLKLLIINSFKI